MTQVSKEKQNRILYPIHLTNGMAFLDLPKYINKLDAWRISKMIEAVIIEESDANK